MTNQQSGRPRSYRRPLIVATAVVLVVASITGGLYLVGKSSEGGKPVQDDGPNFYQALASLNSSVAAQAGGPWSLFSVMGIAAQTYFSSNVVNYIPLSSDTINSCQAELNGPTLFNGTLPVFSGSFNSGTAPFWQFAYYSTNTKEILVGANVLGTPYLFAPFPQTSPCAAAWGDFAVNTSQWIDQIYAKSSLPVNSPTVAQVALANLGSYFTGTWITKNAPLVDRL